MATKEERQTELKRILERDGEIRPSVVVQEAASKANPLHSEFTWDNTKAANLYRIGQARHLIRTTVIRMDTGEQQRLVHVPPVEPIEQPTAVISDREGSYKPMKVVAQNSDEFLRSMNELQTQLRALERTIRQLQRAAGHQAKPLIVALDDAMKIAKELIQELRSQHSLAT